MFPLPRFSRYLLSLLLAKLHKSEIMVISSRSSSGGRSSSYRYYDTSPDIVRRAATINGLKSFNNLLDLPEEEKDNTCRYFAFYIQECNYIDGADNPLCHKHREIFAKFCPGVDPESVEPMSAKELNQCDSARWMLEKCSSSLRGCEYYSKLVRVRCDGMLDNVWKTEKGKGKGSTAATTACSTPTNRNSL